MSAQAGPDGGLPVLNAALGLAQLGYPVFPVHGVTDGASCTCGSGQCKDVGKHPRTPHGFKDATIDEATIREWWRRWPDSNVGIATAGLFVLDVDPRHGGDRTLAELEAKHGNLPSTATARTGGDGSHYVLRSPAGVTVRSRSGILPGLDVRANGGYIVAPPSRHESGGAYRWLDGLALGQVDVAEAPDWLVALACREEHTPEHEPGQARRSRPAHRLVDLLNRDSSCSSDLFNRAIAYAAKVPAKREGERNRTAFSLAGHLAAFEDESGKRLGEEEVLELVSMWNARCDPPLSDSELRKAVGSALHNGTPRSPKKPGKKRQGATPKDASPPAVPETQEQDEDDGPNRKLTDTGNAERLVDRFGERTRFCHPWKKWLAWDGCRWAIDQRGTVMHLSKEVVRGIYVEASTAEDDMRVALAAFAHKSEKADRRKALVELAKSELGIPIVPDSLDQDEWLFNCSSGTIDLRTGKLRPHRREDYLTKIAPTAYDSEAECPNWCQFLDRVLPDPEVRDFVQRAAGYSLTGDVGEQVLFFLLGGGANGKSTFLRMLQETMGMAYAIQAAPDLLLSKQSRNHPTELADLFRVRMAVCMEVGADRAFDEVIVKQATGGDRIRARRMKEDFWEFDPTHKLWLGANHRPRVQGTDEAVWRRILVVPFLVFIPEDQRDKQLVSKLRKELPGILAWMVRGCLAWHRDGLNPPDKVRLAVRDYRSEMDHIGRFLDEVCVFASHLQVAAADLYSAYVAWCQDAECTSESQRALGLRLTQRGAVRLKRGTIHYRGVALRGRGGEPAEAVGPWGSCGPTSALLPSRSTPKASNHNQGPQGPHGPECGPGDPEKAGAEESASTGVGTDQEVSEDSRGVEVDPVLPETDGPLVLRRVGVDGLLATEDGRVVRFSSLTLLGNDRYLTPGGREIRVLNREGAPRG